MGSFGARDAIFPLTLRLEFIEPSTTIVHEPPLPRAVQDASYRSGPGDRLAVRPALRYSVQPVHWTGSLALITLVFTVQPVQVAQSSAITHHTPHTTHHTPLRCCPDHSSSSDSSSWSESSSTMKSHLRAPRGKEK